MLILKAVYTEHNTPCKVFRSALFHLSDKHLRDIYIIFYTLCNIKGGHDHVHI